MHAERVALHMSQKRMPHEIDRTFGALGLTLLILVVSLDGCVGPKRQVNYTPGEYQQVVDRQKSGLAPSADEVDVIRSFGGSIASILSSYEKAPPGHRQVHIRAINLDPNKLPQLIHALKEKATLLYMVDYVKKQREIYS